MTLIEFTNKIYDIIVKFHKNNERFPQRFKTKTTKKFLLSDTRGMITIDFHYEKRVLGYRVVITKDAEGVFKLVGTIEKADNIPIARSRLKHHAFTIYISESGSVLNSVFVKMWPVVRYWQDVAQLHWTEINTFELLYGKVAGLLKKLKKGK